MRVYFIRHGETYANAEKRFAGHWDVDLNENGKQQAELIGVALKAIKFEGALVSDLNRAVETSKAIIQYHDYLEPIVSETMREMNFGEWEQANFKEIETTAPEALNTWFQDFENFKTPGGESVTEMYERVVNAYNSFIESYDKSADINLLVVAHGGVIQALLSYLCFNNSSGYWKFRIQNCTVNMIEYSMGLPVVNCINQRP